MAFDMLRTGEAKQIAGYARIVEIELGTFDETLADIAETGFEPKQDIARFHEIQPVACRSLADAAVFRQLVQIEYLPDIGRA